MSAKKVFQLLLTALSVGLMMGSIGCSEGSDDENNEILDTNPVDTNPVDTNPVDTNSVDTDTPSVTSTPVDSTPVDIDTMEEIGSHTFDAGIENWSVVWSEPQDDTDFVINAMMLEHITTDGFPDAGAIQITTPAPKAPEYKVQVAVALDTPVDLTKGIITAKIKLADGFINDPSAPPGAKIFVKSGDAYLWANGSWTNLEPAGEWIELLLEMDYPDFTDQGTPDTDGNYPVFDLSDIREIGVEFATGETLPDTEADTSYSYLPGIVVIDNVTYSVLIPPQ